MSFCRMLLYFDKYHSAECHSPVYHLSAFYSEESPYAECHSAEWHSNFYYILLSAIQLNVILLCITLLYLF
jgi:hypothetical protein